MGSGPWLTVCIRREKVLKGIAFYCALIPKRYVKKFFEQYSWDFSFGDGAPGIWQIGGQPSSQRYTRFGRLDGIEPFVLWRTYDSNRESHFELTQEFRLYSGLFYDSKRQAYLTTDPNGNVDEVVKMEERVVEVKRAYLHRFLAAKQMHLGIFFDGDAFVMESLAELGLQDGYSIPFNGRNIRYAVTVRHNSINPERGQTWSRLLGKILVRCQPRGPDAPFPSRQKKSYCDFIVGCDDKGEPIRHTCDPQKLANGFGQNPNAPHFLTPVHFRRQVLQKYYDNPQQYEVGDGNVQCGGQWSLRIDNDHPERVIVWLGDLGQGLNAPEHLHWQHYNIIPEGVISRTSYKRNIAGEFADPEMPDLIMKHLYPRLNDAWQRSFGFGLFLQLQPQDEHVFKMVRVPLSDNRGEFDAQVLSLAKLLVDCLNEAALQEQIGKKVPNEKGIAKLERWFKLKGLNQWEIHIKFMRNLQALRGGAAHRKGESYEKAAEAFLLQDRSLMEAGKAIFESAVLLIRYLLHVAGG